MVSRIQAMALVMWSLAPAAAQQPLRHELQSPPLAPLAKRFPLRAIVIEGNEHFPTDAIVKVTGLELGRPVTDADFRRAIGKLRDAGAFEVYEYRFGPQEDGYRVTFKLQEASPLYPLRMEGFAAADEELRALLEKKVPLMGKMVPAAGPMIDRIGAVLQHFWRKAGNRSKVIGGLAPLGEDGFAMLFRPRAAIKTIAFATFENTGELSPLDLQRVFNQIAMGVPYSESRLKELLHYNIRPLYEEKGRLEVTFCPCRAGPDPDSEGLLVSIAVQPGEVYTFNSVELKETSAVDRELLDSLIKINQGEKADLARVRKAIAAIERLLKANGFMNALGRFDTELDTEAKTVDVIIQVERGDRYTFNKLTIQGLDIIGEDAVRKRWAIGFGDPFNASYPQKFLSRITREGMFDKLSKTDWKIKTHPATKTVDVTLIFD